MTVSIGATELRVIAAEAARAAGELLLERFLAGGERATGSKSSPTDVVSEADLAAERAIRELIAARRPGDAILGEEGGETQAGEERRPLPPDLNDNRAEGDRHREAPRCRARDGREGQKLAML